MIANSSQERGKVAENGVRKRRKTGSGKEERRGSEAKYSGATSDATSS